MAADETPAQPAVGQCMRMSPSLFAEHRASCALPWGHRGAHTDGTAHWTLVIDGEPVEFPDPSAHVRPDAAPAPGADEQFRCICDGSPVAVKGCPAHRVRYAAQQFARGQGADQTLIGLASVLGVENVAPTPDGTLAHKWASSELISSGAPCDYCVTCGGVRRRDDANPPCRGPVGVELRAPAPDGNAGGAGDEAYLAAAEAYIRHNPEIGGMEPLSAAPMLVGHPPFRAAIDAARAPLLADVAQLQAELARVECMERMAVRHAADADAKLAAADAESYRRLTDLAEGRAARLRHEADCHTEPDTEVTDLRAELAAARAEIERLSGVIADRRASAFAEEMGRD